MKVFTSATLIIMFLLVNLLILDVLAAPDTQKAENDSQEERGGRLRKGLSTRRGSRPRTSRRMRNKDGGEESNVQDNSKMRDIAKPVAAIQPELVTEGKLGNLQKDRHNISPGANGNDIWKPFRNRFSFTTVINSLAKELERFLLSLSRLLNVRRNNSKGLNYERIILTGRSSTGKSS